jgi:hypothetical protein
MLLRLVKATTSSNGGQVLTLSEVKTKEPVATPFGTTNRSSYGETFYMKVQEAPEKGFEAEVDLDNFRIVERPFTTSDGKEIVLKWLYAL